MERYESYGGLIIKNLFMKLILKVFTCLALISLISGFHVLKHFNKDIDAIKHHFKEGDTSKVFSTFMKMLYHTRTLYDEMKIPHPKLQAPPDNANCITMMHEIVNLFKSHNWVESYEEIYPKLNQIQQKCTNADFIAKGGSNGFDNKCALCTVLSRVMENYITYHRKDVAKFVVDDFCSMFDGLVKPTC